MTIRFAQASATALGLLILTSCSLIASVTSPSLTSSNTASQTNTSPQPDSTRGESTTGTQLWAGEWTSDDWMTDWGVRGEKSWGLDNLEVISNADADTEGPFQQILRVQYPAGSASPSVSRSNGVALGGAQFYADLALPPQPQLRLSYFVRFSDNFDFVKGGKLPGLFGGEGASGGTIPDGTDGFSTRFMWRRAGAGEVYAYLPTSEEYGTSIGRGAWQFQPGVWYQLEQVVQLNQPDQADGKIQVWVNGNLILEQRDIRFRTVESLQIDGIFFSTFFGGGDASWATPQDVYVDFADFSVSAVESDSDM